MWKLILLLAATAAMLAGTARADEIDQSSAVFVKADCVNPANGAVTPGSGSGVIVTGDGYVVTAYHVVKCWMKQPETAQADHPLKVRIGSVYEEEKSVSIVRTVPEADYAILKIEGLGRDYVPASTCILRRPKMNTTSFTAIGFPKGQEYQPSVVTYGTNVGNFWTVAGSLTFGMSGGGVYFDQRLVGIVTGGDPDSSGTINEISPIFRVARDIEDETGHVPILVCSVLENVPIEPGDEAGVSVSTVSDAAAEASEGIRTMALPVENGGVGDPGVIAPWFGPTDEPKVISVCWENPSDQDILERGIAQDAVAKSWGRYSDVDFVGWERCAAESAGIRLRIDDTVPHSMGLGRQLDGRRDGVVVNLTFDTWGKGCKVQLENCIRSTAVHEFGHVLGFRHEHERSDAPAECQQRTSETTYSGPFLTPYDPESVMNYCSDGFFAAGGALSWYDIVKLRAFYAAPA